jgi:3-hydroxybutyryl-CoA dehydratase
MSEIRRQTIAALQVGTSVTITRTFTAKDVDDFSAVTRDHNPIHFHPQFVELKGFRGRICHGLLVGSMLTEVGGQMAWLASGMNFRFKNPVYFNDTITCCVTLVAVDANCRAEASARFTNQNGETVIEASLFGVLPNHRERQALAEIAAGGPLSKPSQACPAD